MRLLGLINYKMKSEKCPKCTYKYLVPYEFKIGNTIKKGVICEFCEYVRGDRK